MKSRGVGVGSGRKTIRWRSALLLPDASRRWRWRRVAVSVRCVCVVSLSVRLSSSCLFACVSRQTLLHFALRRMGKQPPGALLARTLLLLLLALLLLLLLLLTTAASLLPLLSSFAPTFRFSNPVNLRPVSAVSGQDCLSSLSSPIPALSVLGQSDLFTLFLFLSSSSFMPRSFSLFSTQSRTSSSFGASLTRIHYPSDVAISPQGKLFVSDYSNSRVLRFDLGTISGRFER